MDTGFTIRKATLDDCTALTDLCMRSKQSNGYDDAFMAMCAEELKVRDSWIEEHDFWLAQDARGEPVGCIRLSMEDDGETGELETCFVDPAWQGRRVGRALFDALHERAQSLGLVRIGLDADPFAEPFYARMGFKTIGRSPSGSIPGRTLPRMELILISGQQGT
ncbi:Amino-acid acetyltransferase [Labrenzia sp. THAF191b]|uniref:GNAT family N-acetyltransferase n=1 Tax=unclassified Labrenzia TaxID=2648686 RepID=UPI0012678D78|nr:MULTISPECIES: GNAT family N-acetyltransferase [unclassified Labrenzia]QFS98812.1 Amino-acid acetyltransferase [Labrenzia sp. THAF191b]QFT05126.1 Amino-acid acetyltransferase [Labrenzia sp. THAF191a]QFT16670.1 Amino-acid acetyltransferase [Labrenzia sp. THAF187b]